MHKIIFIGMNVLNMHLDQVTFCILIKDIQSAKTPMTLKGRMCVNCEITANVSIDRMVHGGLSSSLAS